MPADRRETYQLQIASGKWVGGLPIQKGHATIGGKVYPTVKMPDGSVWMAQNLDVLFSGISLLNDYSNSWYSPTAAYWEFDAATYSDRGLFYNGPACGYIEENQATLCPGWHVPSASEFDSVWPYIYPSNVSNLLGFDLSVYGHGTLKSTGGGAVRGWYASPSDPYYFFMYNYNAAGYGTYTYFYAMELQTSGSIRRFSGNIFRENYNSHYPIRLVMDDPSQFVPDTTEYMNARTQYTRYWRPQVTFEFSESDFNPNGKGLFNSSYGGASNFKWTKVSDSPNRWRLDVGSQKGLISGDPLWGLAFLCNSNTSTNEGLLTPTQLGTCTCKIVSFGNMDNVETMDRSFFNCTSLTQVPSSIPFGSYVSNVAQMFAGCTEVTGGALSLYNQLKDIATISNHSETFKDCGSNTVTGLAELQQIPLSWGGLLMPPSTTMECWRVESSNPKVKWDCRETAPDWSTEPELYVFTTSSVSQYAGVNMRKTSINNKQNGIVTSGAATYYRVAFVQFVSGSSGAISWVLTTTGYNGMLTAGQSAGDMPGTLSYDNFGVTDKHYGTYDSSKTVYIAFLVTNAAPEDWGGLTDAYGLQGNNYFNAGFYLKWFTA